MTDPESYILEQFVSLTTRDSIQHNVPAVKVILITITKQKYNLSNIMRSHFIKDTLIILFLNHVNTSFMYTVIYCRFFFFSYRLYDLIKGNGVSII